MEWALLLASVIFFASSWMDHANAKTRGQLMESLDRHTAELKRQNEMLAKAQRITVVGIREPGEERHQASQN